MAKQLLHLNIHNQQCCTLCGVRLPAMVNGLAVEDESAPVRYFSSTQAHYDRHIDKDFARCAVVADRAPADTLVNGFMDAWEGYHANIDIGAKFTAEHRAALARAIHTLVTRASTGKPLMECSGCWGEGRSAMYEPGGCPCCHGSCVAVTC